MPEQSSHSPARFQELTESVFRETNAFVAATTDSLKARSAFSEKMIVLNGATLALSFSAASAFHEKVAASQSANGLLFTAWRLLIASIILALVGQWIGIAASANAHASGAGALLGERLKMWEAELKKLTQIGSPDAASIELDLSRKIRKAKIAGTIGERTTNWLAIAAQTLTIAAFIWLYRFAHASLLAK